MYIELSNSTLEPTPVGVPMKTHLSKAIRIVIIALAFANPLLGEGMSEGTGEKTFPAGKPGIPGNSFFTKAEGVEQVSPGFRRSLGFIEYPNNIIGVTG